MMYSELSSKEYIEVILENAEKVHPEMPEYRQALEEFLPTIEPYIDEHPELKEHNVLGLIAEPERIIKFRIPWQDDEGNWRVNMGIRVQFNSAIGPYKGGLRFDPSVTESVVRFLGFEQIFKNGLTGLPIGGGKGGANFDPKGKSDGEIMRFCQSFMTEMQRYLGPDLDVPAGDIGVHAREIGYLYGQYKRINHNNPGVITGKPVTLNGICGRAEATGHGAAYFVANYLQDHDDSFEGKRVVISGTGAVGSRALEKVTELGGKVVAISDITGYLTTEDGVDIDKILTMVDDSSYSLKEFAQECDHGEFYEGESVWDAALNYDIAMPCATQNEINKARAKNMVDCGISLIAEGANMPVNIEGIATFKEAGVIHLPGKAVNAGGVAVSALEMAQNAQRVKWSYEQTDQELQAIMQEIYEKCRDTSQHYLGKEDFIAGANIAGFDTVIKAMYAQGLA